MAVMNNSCENGTRQGVSRDQKSEDEDSKNEPGTPTTWRAISHPTGMEAGGQYSAAADLHNTFSQPSQDIVFWNGSDDPENPMNWPDSKKLMNVALISTWSLLTPLASSMVAPGAADILQEYGSSSKTLGAFVVSIFIFGYAIGPLLLAPLSELYGRLPVYHVSNVLFVTWTLACAFAPNLNALLAFRFLQGVAGVAPLVIGSGSVSDLIPFERRGKFMSLYSTGPLLGPVIGPVAGAYLVKFAGWRWIFRILASISGVLTFISALVLRESYAPVILRRKTAYLRKKTGNLCLRSKLDTGLTTREVFLRAIIRPSKLLLFSPIVLLLSLYMAIVYGYLYLLFTTMTELFIDTYHFDQGTAGLSYLGLGVGMFVGLYAFGGTSDQLVTKLANHYGTGPKPEYRFPLMMVGSSFVPIGLLWYGWSAEAQVHYLMPIVGTAWVGCGLMATFMPICTYLVDSFTIYAASAMAANTVLRSSAGAFLPLAGPQMYASLGLGWGNTLLALIATALSPVTWLFWRYGERIRTSERFKIDL